MITAHEPVFVATSTARNPFLRVPAAAVESGSPGCDQCGLHCVPITEALSGAGAELAARRDEGALGLEWVSGIMGGVCGWSSTSTTQWKVDTKGAGFRSRGRILGR